MVIPVELYRSQRNASLVRFLQSRSIRAGIACKHAGSISYSFFEDFHRIIAAARTSKHHIHRPRELVSWLLEEQ